MSISSECLELVKAIQSKTKTNCYFGNKNYGADDYPLIKVIPDTEFSLIENSESFFIDYELTIKIIVGRENELEALKVFESLFCARKRASRIYSEYLRNNIEVHFKNNKNNIKENNNGYSKFLHRFGRCQYGERCHI